MSGAKKLTKQQLVAELECYRTIVEQAGDAIWTVDLNMRPTYMSPGVTRLLGYSVREAMEAPMRSVFTPTSYSLATHILKEETTADQDRDKQRSRTLEFEFRRKDGSVIPVEVKYTFIRDELGAPVGVLAVARDITERKHEERKLQYRATHDTLCDIPNRELFYDRLGMAVAQAWRKRRKLAVLVLDLDDFKGINDNFGHDAGDELLRMVAKRLSGVVRRSDTFARTGGDEFLVLLPEIGHQEDARRVAWRILVAIRRPFVLKGQEVCVTTSIGLAMYPEHAEDAVALVNNADRAMYLAKDLGRNRCQTFGAQHSGRD